MTPVDSSAVEKVGYDEARKLLFVNFVGDKPTYVYSAVNKAAWRALLRAPSIGEYVNRVIKRKHDYRRLKSRL